ncbi:MAG: hypothetical protein HKN08_05075 [Gammaproteobacteria bacterium]|nr:hypothetical protein [Gammaproteobacteria bacterium]
MAYFARHRRKIFLSGKNQVTLFKHLLAHIRELTLKGGYMAARQDNDDDMDDIRDDIEDGNDIESLMKSIESSGNNDVLINLTARRKIEDLLEEKKLKQQIEDYNDWD